MKCVSRRIRTLLLGILLVAGGAAYGSDENHENEDHNRAFRALQEGEAKPLTQILETVKKEIGGDIIGVDFESVRGRNIYELKVVAPDGRLREVYVDAMTAEILSGEQD